MSDDYSTLLVVEENSSVYQLEEAPLHFAGFHVGWNLEMLVLEDEGTPGNSEKNPRSKARTNNKLNPLYSNTGQN